MSRKEKRSCGGKKEQHESGRVGEWRRLIWASKIGADECRPLAYGFDYRVNAVE